MTDRAEAIDAMAGFRLRFYRCLTARADALFESAEALLCTDGPVKTLVGLSLAPEHRRGHGALYDALDHGRIEVEALRRQLSKTPLPRAADGRLVLAVDVSPWLRPDGDRDILIVLDAGYEAPRIAWLLRRPTPPRVYQPLAGRPSTGLSSSFGDPATWDSEQAVTQTDTRLYGQARARAWDRLHPRLTHRAAWADHDGPLPIIAGTVVRLTVDHLPSRGEPKPVWLWWSKADATAADVDRCWQAFPRRFDLEHTFRMIKQTLGWTAPKLRDPAAADRWTWLIPAAHTQLCLARPLAQDLRRPWERPVPPQRLTPARVRRGFRSLHATSASPARAPKPSKPGPGRPPGSRNRHTSLVTLITHRWPPRSGAR